MKNGILNKDYVVKKMKNNGELIIREVDYQTAKEMVMKNHYSKKWNTAFGKYNYGIYKDGRLLGVAVYGNLMNPKSAKKIVESGKVIELNRLWIDDELGHNTETTMLSATFTLLKNNTDFEAVQSFADGRLGVGTIYKASNFKYYGKTKSMFYENKITKEAYHQAPFDNTARPFGFLTLNKMKINNELDCFVVNTYRYIFKLSKKAKILLKEEKYPQYQKGYEYMEVKYPIGVSVRLLLMYNHIGYVDGYNKTSAILNDIYDYYEIKNEIEKQKNNTYYKKFVNDYPKKEQLLNELLDNKQLSLFD